VRNLTRNAVVGVTSRFQRSQREDFGFKLQRGICGHAQHGVHQRARQLLKYFSRRVTLAR
jgi:hypothetical protein